MEQLSQRKLPVEMEAPALDRCREIMFILLAAGFKNLEPKYYVFEGDRRNTEVQAEAN